MESLIRCSITLKQVDIPNSFVMERNGTARGRDIRRIDSVPREVVEDEFADPVSESWILKKKSVEHRFLERTGLVKSVEHLHGQTHSFGKPGKHGQETDVFSQLAPEVGRAPCDIRKLKARWYCPC
jgi:hypothetical protein